MTHDDDTREAREKARAAAGTLDPEKNLQEQLKLAQILIKRPFGADDAERLAELVLAMHLWLESGGRKPERWM